MEIQKIEKTYGRSPQADALFDLMGKKSVHSIFLQGLLCSSAPMFFASLQGKMRRSLLFVLDDADEAGYFYRASHSDDGAGRSSSFLPAIGVP